MTNKPTYQELEAQVKKLEQAQSKYELLTTELQESEGRFKALSNATFGGIVIHEKGLILECNDGLSIMTATREKSSLV